MSWDKNEAIISVSFSSLLPPLLVIVGLFLLSVAPDDGVNLVLTDL